MNSGVSAAGGGVVGISGSYANYQTCQHSEFFQSSVQKCAELFGPLRGWAADNPIIAAALLAAIGFLVIQGIQWVVQRFMELS